MMLAETPAPPAIGLGEAIARLEAMRFDGECEAAFIEAAPLLQALAADRGFLGDLLIDELHARARGQERGNSYGPQVVMLHRGPGWFLRANIWPDRADPLLRASGPERFFYGVPHDHNFTFLTIGYLGPGYWSDYWEPAEGAAPLGMPGEPVPLRFVERTALPEGRSRLYRAHRDIHCQHPPDATSVSLNLAQGTPGRAFVDQFRFDLDRQCIAAQLALSATDMLVALAPALGGEAGAALLADFAARHPSERIRFGAILAQARAASPSERRRILEHAADDPNGRIAARARFALTEPMPG